MASACQSGAFKDRNIVRFPLQPIEKPRSLYCHSPVPFSARRGLSSG
jgi:hypothetical protein